MSKTPLLDELRAQRERQEKEILAPAVQVINKIQNDYVELWREKNRIAKLATGEFGQYFLKEFFAKVSMHFRRKYLRATKHLDKEFVTIKISSQILKVMLPEQFENYCLRHYANDLDEKLDMGISEDIMNTKMQILSVYMPKMDYHQTVAIKE